MDILIRGNSLVPHLLQKVDWSAPLFKTASSNQALAINTDAYARVGRFGQVGLDLDRSVTLPTLTAGTDYAVYLTADGLLIASANFTAPDGYTAAQVTLLGGFHYAPGGNAAAQAGGNSTPQINPLSIWDLKWRPSCPDPRGMALVCGVFWGDIYWCNTNPDLYGTSRFGLTIADGASLPVIPAMFGGNGSTLYTSFGWWMAAEVARSAGKGLLDFQEAIALCYGVTEGTSVGSDPVTTKLDAPRTSRWGIHQATGNMWTWGRGDAVDPNSTTAGAWQNTAGGRGQTYEYGSGNLKFPLFAGGYWNDGSYAGSRASDWGHAPSSSSYGIGARFRSDHLKLP